MSKIAEIPKSYHRGFENLYLIDDETFYLLIDSLAKSPLVFSPANLAKKISSIAKIESDVIGEILASVGSLVPIRVRTEISPEEIASDISESIKQAKLFDVSKDEEKFRKRIVTLLENEQLYYSSKSVDLATDYENIFISAKINTDIRPVFGKNVADTPKAGLIIHNLQLHYHAGEEEGHRDIFVALDPTDIKNLQKVLSRAQEKEKTLKILLKNSGMTNLTFREE